MPNYECPTCKKTIAVDKKEDAPFRPFCTKRCKMIDLGRWLDGTYTITEEANPPQFSRDPDNPDPSSI